MSFTLAHPAAAVLLRAPLGRYGVLAALVVGSLAPDFVYYLPLGVERSESHGLAGMFWFCLPLGLLGYALFYACLRPAAVLLVPAPVRRRLPEPPPRLGLSGRSIGAISISILIGVATHLAWDSFTHSDGFLVGLLPPLQHRLGTVAGYPVVVFKVLQHGGTVIGLALLALWSWHWLRATAPREEESSGTVTEGVRTAARIALIVAVVVTGYVVGMGRAEAGTGAPAFQLFVVHAAIGATAALGSVLLVIGMSWRLWEVGVRRAAALRGASGRREDGELDEEVLE